jgi:hypothetical protein
MITNCLKCAECAAALVVENNSQPSLPDHTYGQSCSSMPPSLISFKSYGSLINPSTSVLKTVKVADSRLRLLAAKWSNLPEKALETLQRYVLQEVKPSAFQSLQHHGFVQQDISSPVLESLFRTNCQARGTIKTAKAK